MAGIMFDLTDDIEKLQSLKNEIGKVKKSLEGINVKVDIDIAKDMEAQLKALTAQYDALVKKVSEAEGKILASTQRINEASEKIIKAQEQLAKASTNNAQQGNTQTSTTANNADTESVQAQAKAYDELADEIDAVMGSRAQNIRRMIEEQNAIRLINDEIKNMTKYQGANSTLSSSQQKRLEQLNASLLQHKTALSELRQSLNNSFKLDSAAATSMNALSQSLARMRMTYRQLTEEERNSPFGQELLASIQQADARIKQLDATIGNHQRNVGNYASGWNGLNVSIQQIGRELPSLAMGWNTFFLAISNNLPIFTDELARARKEYDELKKSGQAATPVWKQVVSSLLSWQTALTVGITLLTLYGKDIIAWVGNLFKAKDGTAQLEEATKRLNKAVSEVYANASEEMRTLKGLNDSLQQAKRGTEEWNQIRNKIVTGYSKYLPSIDDEIEKTGTLASSYDRLTESIQKAAAARGFEQYRAEEDKKYIEERNKTVEKVYNAMIKQLGEDKGNELYREWLNYLNTGMYPSLQKQGEFGQIGTGLGSTANYELIELIRLAEARDKSIEKFRNMFGMTEGAEEDLPSDSIKALRDRISAMREALEKLSVNSQEYKDLLKQIQEEEQKLASITGTTTTSNIKNEADQLKSYLDELAQLRQDNEDREVELMQEGTDKQLREIDLRYDRILEKVRTLENNLKKQQGGSLTQDQQSMFDVAYGQIGAQREQDKSAVTGRQFQAEREAMNKYLQEYGTYWEKRWAIAEDYNRRIAEAITEGERLTLGKEQEKALQDLDIEAAKTSSTISKLFGNMADKTLKELERLRDEGTEMLDFLKGGQWDAGQGKRFGLSEDQFKSIIGSPEQMQALSDAVKDIERQVEQLEPPLEKVKQGFTDLFNAGGDNGKLQQALSDIRSGLGGVMEAAQFLGDTFSQLGDAFDSGVMKGIGEGIDTAVNTASSALQGALLGGLFFGPIGAIGGAAISLFSSIGSAIAQIHDKKNEKRIQRLQDQIDELTDSYDELGRSIEEAYSKSASGLIEDQNKLLEQQKLLIQQQIREEEDKKKTDEDRIKDWKEQIEEINQTIEDNKQSAIDAIFGEDVQSAIERFVSSWSEAWSSNEDRTNAARNAVKQMMQQMVEESIKDMIKTSGAMEQIREKLQQFYADNVLTGWEQDYIYNMAEELQKQIDEQFGWSEDLFKDDTSTEQSASSKGFETMSQDSADELNGRFTALYESNLRIEGATQQQTDSITEIKGSVSALIAQATGIYNIADETRGILVSSYLELQQISENTGEIIKPIKQMQKDIEAVKNKMNVRKLPINRFCA